MPTPIDWEIIRKGLEAICEEMGMVLQKASFSPNIKERRDFSCAIFDRFGQLIAQAAHIPVHLGAMPDTVAYVSKNFPLEPGDIIITNDPYRGGTHLPDITLIKGVFLDQSDTPNFYLVTRAHHADVGGRAPGSMALATSIEDEGVLLRPSYLYKNDHLNHVMLDAFLSQVRNPEEREGDLMAQVASLARGEVRLREMAVKNTMGFLEECIQGLIDYGERVILNTIKEIPNGTYEFQDFLDDDGTSDAPVRIHCSIKIDGNRFCADFSRSAPQVKTSMNTVKSVTASAVYYCLFCLVGEGYPSNAGTLRPVEVQTRPGTVVDAVYPAPVAAGNVETSQRIVDCVLGALSKAIPDKIPAASAGTMNNLAIGGRIGRGTYAYYETIGGGMGARPGAHGISGVQTHMTNTLNTPVEAMEQSYPIMVEKYGLRRGSGGEGKYFGGDGIVRRIRFLEDAHVSILSERRRRAPYGLFGGMPGKRGENLLLKRGGDRWEALPGKCSLDLERGDVLEIRTPGGGGWGSKHT